MALNFNVVFQYTEKAGGYLGVRTSTGFENELEFDKWYAKLPDERKERERVIAKGVTADEAIRICEETPLKFYINAAIQEGTGKDGNFYPFIAAAQLVGAMEIKRASPIELAVTIMDIMIDDVITNTGRNQAKYESLLQQLELM